jgi:hypothetical protein
VLAAVSVFDQYIDCLQLSDLLSIGDLTFAFVWLSSGEETVEMVIAFNPEKVI